MQFDKPLSQHILYLNKKAMSSIIFSKARFFINLLLCLGPLKSFTAFDKAIPILTRGFGPPVP